MAAAQRWASMEDALAAQRGRIVGLVADLAASDALLRSLQDLLAARDDRLSVLSQVRAIIASRDHRLSLHLAPTTFTSLQPLSQISRGPRAYTWPSPYTTLGPRAFTHKHTNTLQELGERDGRLRALEENLEGRDERVSGLEEELWQRAARTRVVEAECEGLQTRVQSLERQVEAAEDECVGLRARVQVLELQVTACERAAHSASEVASARAAERVNDLQSELVESEGLSARLADEAADTDRMLFSLRDELSCAQARLDAAAQVSLCGVRVRARMFRYEGGGGRACCCGLDAVCVA